MNLLAMATLVGKRCGQVQPNDLTACKLFLQMRHDQVWRAKLWKDSLIEYVLTIDPTVANYVVGNPYMPTKGVLILPSIFQQVIAVRTNLNKLNVTRPMIYYRVDFDQLARTSNPLEFFLLKSAVLELDTPQTIVVAAGDATDYAQIVLSDTTDSDEAGITRVSSTLAAYPPTIGTTDLIDSLTKPATKASVRIAQVAQITTTTAFTAVSNVPFPVHCDTTNLAENEIVQLIGTSNSNGLSLVYTVTVASILGSSAFTGSWNQAAGDSAADLMNTGAGVFAPSSASLLTLGAADTEAPRRQRIRFVDIPNSSVTVRVLGKRRPPTFSNDGDIPGINGMTPILLALAYYDMMHRDERGSAPEATNALREAVGTNWLEGGPSGGLLKQLEDEEVVQAAYNTRMIPESGFGDPTEFEVPSKFQ